MDFFNPTQNLGQEDEKPRVTTAGEEARAALTPLIIGGLLVWLVVFLTKDVRMKTRPRGAR
jgi:hypothetical protein